MCWYYYCNVPRCRRTWCPFYSNFTLLLLYRLVTVLHFFFLLFYSSVFSSYLLLRVVWSVDVSNYYCFYRSIFLVVSYCALWYCGHCLCSSWARVEVHRRTWIVRVVHSLLPGVLLLSVVLPILFRRTIVFRRKEINRKPLPLYSPLNNPISRVNPRSPPWH